MKRIIVVHEIAKTTRTDVFICESDRPGDFSITWNDMSMSLTMRRGLDEQGNAVTFKQYARAWTSEVRDEA